MSSTFFLFMTPAVLSFEVSPFSRSINKKLHGSLNSFAFISVIVGLYIILDCHQNLHDEPIINPSIHSIAGYMTIGLLVIVYFVGFIFYGIGCGSNELKKSVKPYHKRLGTVALFCGYGTILLGLAETINKETQIDLGQLMAGFVFLTMLGVVFSLIKFTDKPHAAPHLYELTDNEDIDDDDEKDNAGLVVKA